MTEKGRSFPQGPKRLNPKSPSAARRKVRVDDQRTIRDIRQVHVTWQLALVVVALFSLPVALIAPYMAIAGDRSVPGSAVSISLFVALGLILMMAIAIRSRVRAAADEVRADDQPMPTWILRQVLIGVGLCVVAAVLLAFLAWSGVRMRLAVKFGLAFAAPGILLIARAMVPPN